MDINYLKMDNKADISLAKNKLTTKLESLKLSIENELYRIKEKENYEPSSSLGLIGAEGNTIDCLIATISALNKNKKMLESLEDKTK